MPSMIQKDTLESFDARLAVLDALIAKTHAAIVKRDAAERYELAPRPLAFALPVAHASDWYPLAKSSVTGSMLCPGDSRWQKPTLVTGPVDASVAFAVAMAIGEAL
jgi:hypothetical protein